MNGRMLGEKVESRYKDILYQPHPNSKKRVRMSMSDRAAQFSPFAALTGYDAAVKETARLTSEKVELDENEKEHLDQQMQLLVESLERRPIITILYFQQDDKKEGGRYERKTGIVTKIDLYEKNLVFEDKRVVAIKDIYEIAFENKVEYE